MRVPFSRQPCGAERAPLDVSGRTALRDDGPTHRQGPAPIAGGPTVADSAGSCRLCPVACERLVYPSGCLESGCTRLYERSDSGVRGLEGLSLVTGWLRGSGDTEVTIREHDWTLTLDVASGHKTGFYLDQRDNRALFAQWVQRLNAKRVLNGYCYTGGFTVAALAGGAEAVTSIDSSAPALARVQEHVQRNGFDVAKSTVADADVNAFLREALKAGEHYDAIVLDPPKFAPTAAHAERAARAYKDINRLALKLLAPGGLLFTFSCSGGVGAELFHKIVAGAGIDAEVDGAIVERLQGAPDHPTTLAFPEGEYLKGLAVLRS